jgi:uncharacterized Zn-finger protein
VSNALPALKGINGKTSKAVVPSSVGKQFMNDQERKRLIAELQQSSNCSHPIRLQGEAVNLVTGEVGEGTFKIACKDRREVLCPACSYLYRTDAWILASAGLNGGKGVPEGVQAHPRLFVTLTAPPSALFTQSGTMADVSSGAGNPPYASMVSQRVAVVVTSKMTSSLASRSVVSASTTREQSCGTRTRHASGA